MINELFLFFYNNIIVTSLLMLSVIIAGFFMRKSSKRIFCIIWAVLLVRLLVPVNIDMGFGILNVPVINSGADASYDRTGYYSEAMTVLNLNVSGNLNTSDNLHASDNLNASDNLYSSDDLNTSENLNVSEELDAGDRRKERTIAESRQYSTTVHENVSEQDTVPRKELMINADTYDHVLFVRGIIPVLAVIWLVGMVIMPLAAFIRYIPVMHKKRFAIRHKTEKNVYIWPDKTGACVSGLLRPVIYIPYGVNEVSERILIEHERVHIRRKDNILAAGYLAALIINWMNPLMWIVIHRLRDDIELACDEEVLDGSDVYNKRMYAGLLVDQLQGDSLNMPVMLSFGFGNIKKRIIRIGGNYKVTNKKKIIAVIMSVLVMGFAVTACTDKKDEMAEKTDKTAEEPAADMFMVNENWCGVDEPMIDYADDNRVILHDYTGMYVYNIKKGFVTGYVNAKDYGLKYTQGDKATQYSVNKNGDTVYITVGNKTKYVYDVDKDSVTKSDKDNPDPYDLVAHDPALRSDNEPRETEAVLNKTEGYSQQSMIETDGEYKYYSLAFSYPSDNVTELSLMRINPGDKAAVVNPIIHYEDRQAAVEEAQKKEQKVQKNEKKKSGDSLGEEAPEPESVIDAPPEEVPEPETIDAPVKKKQHKQSDVVEVN